MATLTAAPAIGYLNRAAGKTITATSNATGYADDNLATTPLHSSWRSTSLASQNVDVDLGASSDIDLVGLVGTNLTDDATKAPVFSEASNFSSPEHNPGATDAFDLTTPPLLDPTGPYGRNVIHLPGQTFNSRYVRMTLADAANPAGYMAARVYWVGPVWQAEYGMLSEVMFSPVGVPGIERMLAVCRLSIKALVEAQAMEIESVLRAKLRSGRYLVVPRPLSPGAFASEAIYCTQTGEVRRLSQPTYPRTWDVEVEFTEVED